MAEWIAIGSGGPETVPVGVLERLDRSKALFHCAPEHPSFNYFLGLGFDVRALSEGAVPENGIMLIPIDPEVGFKKATRGEAVERLATIVDRLLGPGGCPWDQEQTHESLKRYLIEEAYELFEAIDAGDDAKMLEELGDVLLQPLMHSQIRARDGAWGIGEVADAISDKLIRRHPHVFGDTSVETAEEVLKNWDKIKQAESASEKPNSILGGVPLGMPSLLRAMAISKRAARCGFEWQNLQDVLSKLDEERDELREAILKEDLNAAESEIGDVLFTVVNVARWLKVDPEEALRSMLNRFQRRFEAMEQLASCALSDLSPEAWDDLWNQAKSITSES